MKNLIPKRVMEYIIITFAVVLMDVGIYVFKFPNNFSFGGVSGIKSAPVFEIIFESVGESGVHIKRGSVIDRGCDHADVELCGHLIGGSVEPAELGADDIAVVIYRRDAAHVAAVGDLIAVGVEAVARAAVCNGLL